MFSLGSIGPLFGDIKITDSPGAGKIAVSDANGNLSWSSTITGQTWKSADSGARIEIFPDSDTGIIVYDDDGAEAFRVNVGGDYLGDVTIGNYHLGQGAKWIKSLGTFAVRGWLNADDLRAGTITSRHITTTSGTGAKVEILPDGYTGIIAYDTANDVVFKVMIAGDDAGDVEIGHYSSDNGLKWDSGTGTFTVAGKLQTSSSGKRLIIDNSDNTLRLYNLGDYNVVTIDDGIGLGGLLAGLHTQNDNNTQYADVTPAQIVIQSGTFAAAGGLIQAKGILNAGTFLQALFVGYDNVGAAVFGVFNTGVVNCTGGYQVGGAAGVTGSFVDNDGNTVTVSGGIVTSLA